MKSFQTWLSESPVDRTAIWNPPSFQSDVQLAPKGTDFEKMGPGPLRSFAKWYDYNRGSWSDVEEAASSNPQVKQILDKIAQGGSEMIFPKQGLIGNQLQQAVSAMNPYHGNKKGDAQNDVENPAGSTSSHIFRQMGGNANQNGAMTKNAQGDKTSLELRVKELEARIRELENHFKVSGQSNVDSSRTTIQPARQ